MKTSNLLATGILALSFSLTSYAQDTAKSAGTQKATSTVSKEERQKVAQVHENMAACLKSDKDVQECHDEMRSQCQDMNGCGMGPFGRGKMMKRITK